MDRSERVQLHLTLPFTKQPRDHPEVGALLRRGFRIVDLQRLTDRDVSVTLEPASPLGAIEALTAP